MELLRWFDITMNNPVLVDRSKGLEQRPEIYTDVICVHITIEHLKLISLKLVGRKAAVKYSKILMPKIRQDSHHLILVPERSNEWAYGITAPEFMQ